MGMIDPEYVGGIGFGAAYHRNDVAMKALHTLHIARVTSARHRGASYHGGQHHGDGNAVHLAEIVAHRVQDSSRAPSQGVNEAFGRRRVRPQRRQRRQLPVTAPPRPTPSGRRRAFSMTKKETPMKKHALAASLLAFAMLTAGCSATTGSSGSASSGGVIRYLHRLPDGEGLALSDGWFSWLTLAGIGRAPEGVGMGGARAEQHDDGNGQEKALHGNLLGFR